jgi:superfamily II DNA or RNA helicase
MSKKLFLFSKKTKKSSINNEIAILTKEYKENIRVSSYLGKKGYTIPKSILLKEDYESLKKELFVKPEMFGAVFGGNTFAEDSSFAVYRENSNKIYIPRFYGIEKYGLPPSSELSIGEPIDIPFEKSLRDYQENIIDIYMKHVQTPICENSKLLGGGGILEVPCGRGKCLAKDTEIIMYDGSIKYVQDIEVGEHIMGDDSTSRQILSLARGTEQMYEIQIEHGDSYTVNESHILSLYKVDVTDKSKNEYIDIEVTDYLYILNNKSENIEYYGYRVPLEFKPKTFLCDPYQFGGHIAFDLKEYKFNYKNIPREYLYTSKEIRLQVLSGFIDYNGTKVSNGFTFTNYIQNPTIMKDLTYLFRSVGITVIHKPSYYIVSGKKLKSLLLTHNSKKQHLENIPFTLSIDTTFYKINIKKREIGDYYGFEIDGNRRFVLGDFTVTHNTVMGLKIISLLQKKTLIIVHKEFLMNQWIERIQEFLPKARVGKIQGQIVDVENKDIVIGMIQTIYDKEYPSNFFDCFGLTIVDEVHRIGSEQFSRTLLKTITPCMLGISATVDRKDNLTKVLYMFIGNKIYSEDRKQEDFVSVRAIEYKTADREFNETELDFRGTPQFSKMIVKLCDFGPRSDFIVRVIRDLIEENPNNQIMILGHNRSLLKYLHDAIEYRKIATVGYYVGGMKQSALQETELKQIVVATYSMAAEALDIKTLSTLVMVTPKTDIIQSVGRILRMKHDNPIIVDIVDTHDVFQNQWSKRRIYYKKCNYHIHKIDSINYGGMAIDWETDTKWKRVFIPKTGCSKKVVESEDDGDESEITGNIKQGKCLISIEGLSLEE